MKKYFYKYDEIKKIKYFKLNNERIRFSYIKIKNMKSHDLLLFLNFDIFLLSPLISKLLKLDGFFNIKIISYKKYDIEIIKRFLDELKTFNYQIKENNLNVKYKEMGYLICTLIKSQLN